MKTPEHLPDLRDSLLRRSAGRRPGRYEVPALWIAGTGGGGLRNVDPFAFYSGIIGSILDRDPVPPPAGDGRWSGRAVVYNMMVRLTCAWDHDGDGVLAPLNAEGWRETGSFLKAIALLPYIRSLGANTVHLLPVMEPGTDGRRGPLGSPYAVKNPSEFDPLLDEPNTRMPVWHQFGAFVEAAHRLGLRIMVELPLRTMGKDCVWVKDHPDWFYWIGAGRDFMPPSFTPAEIGLAQAKVARGDFAGLPEPARAYREQFTIPPDPSTVRLERGRWIGTAPDGTDVVIPGAFADWPPDDRQPVWDDITYLKFHHETRYNYPAYNTVRMYDSNLNPGGKVNRALWSELADLVAGFAGEFGVDGMMVDMAHALPHELTKQIIGGARGLDPEFAFWAEDFNRTPGQVEAGYDAVLGGQWACQHRPGDFRDMLSWIGRTPELLPHLAAPETHNTPRAAARDGGELYSRYAWTVGCFIPGIPFIHSGFELYERRPVNTGLGFTPEEIASFPAEELPLFSAHALDWQSPGEVPGWITEPLRIRERYMHLVAPGSGAGFEIVEGGNPGVLAFVRSDPGRSAALAVAANTDMAEPAHFRLSTILPAPLPIDLLSGESFEGASGMPEGRLQPGQVTIFSSTEIGK